MTRAPAVAALVLVGCTPPATHGDAAGSPTPPSAPVEDAASASALPPPIATAPAPPVDRRGGIELSPSQGDLPPLLRLHAARAKEKGLTPFVEFYATWCPPCKALKRFAEHPALVDAFQGTYVILLDADDWGDKVRGTGFVSKTIPVFFALDADGKPTGRTMSGDAWGKKPTPDAMARQLKAFFQGG